MQQPLEIRFKYTTGLYGGFQNFSRHPITVNNKLYRTTEHYYQAQKTTNELDHEKVRLSATPKEAKLTAKRLPLKENWDNIKYEVMKDALRYKVQQHPDIRETLLRTGDAILIEDSDWDYIWGCGKDGTGQNLLGKAWMEIRNEC